MRFDSVDDMPDGIRRLYERQYGKGGIKTSPKVKAPKNAEKGAKNSSKLKNKKTVVNGIEFDSKREAERYTVLHAMEQSGLISDLQLQVKYCLLPPQKGKTRNERAVTYIADFVYKRNGETVVEDSKGYRNPASATYAKFVLKRKLMMYIHGIEIQEV